MSSCWIGRAQHNHGSNPDTAVHFSFFLSSLLLPSLTRRRFYPQQPSGQAVVTGVSPPVRAFIFIAHRVQHSHSSSIFIECCQHTLSRFPPVSLYARKSPYEYALGETPAHEIDLTVVGTWTTYQATGDAGCGTERQKHEDKDKK